MWNTIALKKFFSAGQLRQSTLNSRKVQPVNIHQQMSAASQCQLVGNWSFICRLQFKFLKLIVNIDFFTFLCRHPAALFITPNGTLWFGRFQLPQVILTIKLLTLWQSVTYQIFYKFLIPPEQCFFDLAFVTKRNTVCCIYISLILDHFIQAVN